MLGGSGYSDHKTEGGLEELKTTGHLATIESFAGYEPDAKKFEWCDKWLKGEEYYHILTHADLYSKVYNLKKYPPKTHPPSTYTNPTSIFFVL